MNLNFPMKNKSILIILVISFSFFSYSQAFLGIGFNHGFINVKDKNSTFSKKISMLLVSDVLDNSPAQKAGILKNDIIASLNNNDIISAEDFKKTLFKLAPKDTITLLIQRDNNSFYKKIILEKPPVDYNTNYKSEENNRATLERLHQDFKLTKDPEMALKYLQEMEELIKNTNLSNEKKKEVLAEFNKAKIGFRKLTELKKEQEFKLSDDPLIMLKQFDEMALEIKKSNWSNSKKQEELAKITDLKKQTRELIQFKKLANNIDDNINHIEQKDKSGKIVSSRLLKYFNDSEDKLILKILNNEINLDPQSKNLNPCGTTLDNCKYKFCNKSITVKTNFRSIGYIIQDLNHLPFFSMNEKDIKEIKYFLGQLRSGKYYVCIPSGFDSFCSKEHLNLHQNI
jgi:hypothetical protein